jgi:hypothetical protein
LAVIPRDELRRVELKRLESLLTVDWLATALPSRIEAKQIGS